MSLFNKILGKKEQGIKKNEEIKKEDVNDLTMERTNSSASSEEALYKYDDLDLIYENLMLANYKVREHGILKEVVLKPYEARLYKV